VSVAIYDAWAAYDPAAIGFVYRQKHSASDLAAARHAAISYAAYRILKERYALSLNASATLAALDARIAALGLDKTFVSTDASTPAGVGNAVAAAVSAWFIQDGARQGQSYFDYPIAQGGYLPINDYLFPSEPGTQTVDPNRWQRLYIYNALDQNGNPIGSAQTFQGAQWLGVRPFALGRLDGTKPWIDPGPQPKLGGAGDAQFKAEVVEVIRKSSELTPDDGATLDISPGAMGNNPLGSNTGSGHPVNPATGGPYTANVVKRGDFARILAEYWADGPNSETPPGHWNVIANKIGEHPVFQRRIAGTGPALDALEWDAKLYFALNAALHDAACAAWSVKRSYDGGRPISFIRHMAGRGQSSDPALPRYHPEGLPLVPGLIELVTDASAQPGERHAGLRVGEVAIRAWPGQPPNAASQYSGVRWIEAVRWLPFQKQSFVTPGFPGYVSGHSTYSRAAAEVLAEMTGSPFFPGGIMTHDAPANTMLTFERGPSEPVQLQWATYYDAADQAGLSRLWGGIHVSVDDLTGRCIGAECGLLAWATARQYFDGTIGISPRGLTIAAHPAGGAQLRCDVPRGLFYKLQSTPDLRLPFTDAPTGFAQALTRPILLDVGTGSERNFYRVVTATQPP
jgi:hypothetical protein